MICWFENHSNIIQYNPTHVFLLSSISNDKHGLPLNKVNVRISISLYTARSIIPNTWRDNPDVYVKPTNVSG
jgi:hypothetical protein